MQIIVTVRTGNAQMQTWGEIRDAIVDAAERAAQRHDEYEQPRDGDRATVTDVNGNVVGALVAIQDR